MDYLVNRTKTSFADFVKIMKTLSCLFQFPVRVDPDIFYPLKL